MCALTPVLAVVVNILILSLAGLVWTTDIGTFWFAWIPGDNFMTVAPTDVQWPAGWTANIIPGFSIQWLDSGSLGQGMSQSGFEFESTLTPAQQEGPSIIPSDPVATSFVYIGMPFNDPGFQLVATPAQTTSTPEPGTIVLTALGIALAGFGLRRYRITRRSLLCPGSGGDRCAGSAS
jgi:hypothetical protein